MSGGISVPLISVNLIFFDISGWFGLAWFAGKEEKEGEGEGGEKVDFECFSALYIPDEDGGI